MRVCVSMGVIVFYKRPRNHIQMSGPDYEESEINEITKLTIDARGTGVTVRARAVRPGGARGDGVGAGGRRTFRAPRAIVSGPECGTQRAATASQVRFTSARDEPRRP